MSQDTTLQQHNTIAQQYLYHMIIFKAWGKPCSRHYTDQPIIPWQITKGISQLNQQPNPAEIGERATNPRANCLYRWQRHATQWETVKLHGILGRLANSLYKDRLSRLKSIFAYYNTHSQCQYSAAWLNAQSLWLQILATTTATIWATPHLRVLWGSRKLSEQYQTTGHLNQLQRLL